MSVKKCLVCIAALLAALLTAYCAYRKSEEPETAVSEITVTTEPGAGAAGAEKAAADIVGKGINAGKEAAGGVGKKTDDEAAGAGTEENVAEEEPEAWETYADMDSYADILALYSLAIREGWHDAEILEERGLNYMLLFFKDPEEAASGLGFTMMDVDGNGVKELLIGYVDQELYGEGNFWVMYTKYNGKVVEVCYSMERNVEYLYEDGEIMLYQYGGAFGWDYIYRKMQADGSLQFEERLEYNREPDASPEQEYVWFYTDEDLPYPEEYNFENYTPVTEAQANKIRESRKAVAIPFTPFAQWVDYRDKIEKISETFPAGYQAAGKEDSVFYCEKVTEEYITVIEYVENAGQDLLFQNVFLIERETGDIYCLNGQDSDGMEYKGNMDEVIFSQAESGPVVFDVGNAYSADRVVDAAYDLIAEDAGKGMNLGAGRNMGQDGERTLQVTLTGARDFLGRQYIDMSAFESTENYAHRISSYCIDMENGNVYRVDGLTGRDELRYLGRIVPYDGKDAGLVIRDEAMLAWCVESLQGYAGDTVNIHMLAEQADMDTSALAEVLGRLDCKVSLQKQPDETLRSLAEDSGYGVRLVFANGGEDETVSGVVPACLRPFVTEEAEEAIELLFLEEGEYLCLVSTHRIDGLTYCYYGFGKSRYKEASQYVGYNPEGLNHMVMQVSGKRKDGSYVNQAFEIPEDSFWNAYAALCWAEEKDLNHDGSPDLLLHLGHSGGSGGSWSNYCGYVWDREKKEYRLLKGMPTQVSVWREDDSLIKRWSEGAFAETIEKYEVVNGEYVQTERMEIEEYSRQKKAICAYYQMGELVFSREVEGYEEIKEIKPEFADYWYHG